MKKVKIDFSYIVKKVEGNTIIFIPTDNVYHHITAISKNYPELLQNDSVYIVHLNHHRLFNVYDVKYTPERYPMTYFYRMVDTPVELKNSISEVLSMLWIKSEWNHRGYVKSILILSYQTVQL